MGEFAVRGERVEREKLAASGRGALRGCFRRQSRAGQGNLRARLAAEGGEAVEVAIRSNDPRFLALPWELMKAPGEREPGGGFPCAWARSTARLLNDRSGPAICQRSGGLPGFDGDRAAGAAFDDAPFQAVARPLFKHLENNQERGPDRRFAPAKLRRVSERLRAAKSCQASPITPFISTGMAYLPRGERGGACANAQSGASGLCGVRGQSRLARSRSAPGFRGGFKRGAAYRLLS